MKMRAAAIAMSLMMMTMLALTGNVQAIDGNYDNKLIGEGEYFEIWLWDWSSSEGDDVDIKVKLNSGAPVDVVVSRDSLEFDYFTGEYSGDIQVEKHLTSPGDKTSFTFEIPDDDTYYLSIVNMGDEGAYVDIDYSEDTSDEDAFVLGVCAIIIIVGAIVLVIIIWVIIKVMKKDDWPPQGGYPPQQGGYPPGQQPPNY